MNIKEDEIKCNERICTREEAVTRLIKSVAKEEEALACILNAECKKIEKVIHMDKVCIEDLLAINNSVECMIKSITELEKVLKLKLEIFVD